MKGVRSQETGVRRQETGDRRQETGVRSRENSTLKGMGFEYRFCFLFGDHTHLGTILAPDSCLLTPSKFKMIFLLDKWVTCN